MTFKIERKASNSGKRAMYYPTVNGLRITATNFARRWEAERLGKAYLAHRVG